MWSISQREWHLMIDQLSRISGSLSLINQRTQKYLDRVEKNRTSSIEVDMPSILHCWMCLDEIHYRSNDHFTQCQHGHVCVPCGPCFECSLPVEEP
jgi:hypothetical protein